MILKELNTLDTVDSNCCFSIKKQQVYELPDKTQLPVGQLKRVGFTPTKDLKELEEFAPEFVAVAKSLWTPEVIERWEAYQKNITLMEA